MPIDIPGASLAIYGELARVENILGRSVMRSKKNWPDFSANLELFFKMKIYADPLWIVDSEMRVKDWQ